MNPCQWPDALPPILCQGFDTLSIGVVAETVILHNPSAMVEFSHGVNRNLESYVESEPKSMKIMAYLFLVVSIFKS